MKAKVIIAVAAPILLAACVLGARTERLARDCADKVVKIGVVTKDSRGVGSGAFITRSGVILTCYHVVNHDKIAKIYIKLENGKVYRGALLAYDEKNDLALVATEVSDVPYFKIGGEVKRGQEVAAFGSPLGLQHTASFGWVENFLKDGRIIHSAFINPGNSGGPLVDMKGRLVGINQFVIEMDIFHTAQGMGGAIPVSTIEKFLSTVAGVNK